jgi:hypothetical protein
MCGKDFVRIWGKLRSMGVTFDLGQADVVRLGNGTFLLPESHRPVLGSPGRDVCGWIMAEYGGFE